MRQKKFKSSTVIPLALLVYLAAMAFYGRGMLASGEALKYYGVIACTLIVLVVLHFSLKKKEKLREKRENDIYTTYAEEEKAKNAESEEKGKEELGK